MSMDEFWTNVAVASTLRSMRWIVDSPKLDPETMPATLRARRHWLSPQTVAGFNVADFAFLSPTDRDRLADAVAEFARIASQVPGDTPPTDDQIEAAIPSFIRILEVMRPDKFADLEALILGKKIENEVAGKLPGWVHDLIFEMGEDWTGGLMIWIFVEADDRVVADEEMFGRFGSIREILTAAVARVCPERWALVSLRGITERSSFAPVKPARRLRSIKKMKR